MELGLDVGNTSINIGFYRNKKLVKKTSWPTAKYRSLSISQKIERVVYASVVPEVDAHFAKYFRKTKFTRLTYKHLQNISIGLPKKTEIGIDRLVNADGAAKFYGAPAVIIDLGTATTFCVLDRNKIYQGGMICPGINLTRLVLYEKTAKLPLITLQNKPKNLIGKSTVEAMQSGIYYGYVALINGLIKTLRKEIAGAKIIATGGYAKLLAGDIAVNIVDTELTLKSLALYL